jgi:hypothetical protein
MAESSPSTPGWPGPSPSRCLVTGASGYIGGRLVPQLLAAGYPVRGMARDRGKLSDRPWSADIEIVAANALDGTGVLRALHGVDVAFYLIHSLGAGASFEQRDRDAEAAERRTSLRQPGTEQPGTSMPCAGHHCPAGRPGTRFTRRLPAGGTRGRTPRPRRPA